MAVLAAREAAYLTTLADRPKGPELQMLVRRMRHGVRRGFVAQLAAVQAVLRSRFKSLEDDALLAMLEEALAPALLRPTIRTHAVQAWLLGARSANAEFSIYPGVGVTSPSLDAYAEGILAPSIEGIHAYTRRRILYIAQTGLEARLPLALIDEEIIAQRMAGVFSDARADLIASYEVPNAFHHARRSAVRVFAAREGKRMEKHWETIGDKLVDAECERNERAGWIPESEPYPTGHDGPLLHARCRCSERYRVVDKKD